MMKKHFSGLTLIILGTLVLLQSLGIYNFGLSLFPAFLIWIGLEMVWGSLFNHWHEPSVFGAVLGLGVAGFGLLRVLANLGYLVGFSVSDLVHLGWPLLLVAGGLSLMVGRRHWRWG